MIDLKNVNYHYLSENSGQVNIFENLNLLIREGEYISLMGRNGSGKSTLARCLNGLLLPSQGEIFIDGLLTSDEKNLYDIRRKVGIVFQNPENQIVSTTVEREIAFGLENIGIPTELMQQIVTLTLDQFHLEKYRTHPPHLLSGGEKQRLALAAIMAMNPKYLILDEPTSMLDPLSRRELLDLLIDIKNDNKSKLFSEQISIILITQFPDETLDSDRLIVLDDKGITFDDFPQIVFQHVDDIKKIGLDVPLEFEIYQFLLEQGLDNHILKNELISFR